MNIFVGLLVALAVAVAVWQIAMVARARAQRGQPAPEYGDLVPANFAAEPQLLFYFFSERCGPCRAMAPTIAAFRARHPQCVSIDVLQHPEAARRFRVMGTPTFVLVENGRIARVLLGGIAPKTLENLLSGSS